MNIRSPLALALTLSSTSCSWSTVTGAPPEPLPAQPVRCTSSQAAPIADFSIGAAAGVGGLIGWGIFGYEGLVRAEQTGEAGDRSEAKALRGLGLALAGSAVMGTFMLSGLYGAGRVTRCREEMPETTVVRAGLRGG